jgi:hypothetical protein
VEATSNPYREYLEQAVATQHTAQDRIDGYLALSMVDASLRFLGRIQPRNRKPSEDVASDATDTNVHPIDTQSVACGYVRYDAVPTESP